MVTGARALTPALGNRMAPATLLDKDVFVRELLPQDLKFELESLGEAEATAVGHYLASVVAIAHARQLDSGTCAAWLETFREGSAQNMNAPAWLWAAVVDLVAADEDFEVPMGPIGKGTVAGYRFELLGMVGTEVRIAVEHVTRIHPDVAPHWPSVGPGGFRVIVEGTPSFTTEVVFNDDDQTTAGCLATAARVVNSIATVCAAPPGVWSFLDLPTITAKGAIA